VNALILVDLQNDFMPGGALPVPDGDAVVPVANRVLPLFDLVVATQDWHPADHISFASQHAGARPGDRVKLNEAEQVLWPDHCIQGSHGAELHRDLDRRRIHHVVQKGFRRPVDSYSGLLDDRRQPTGLHELLRANNITDVYVMGLATDYCVKHTALDAAALGFRTHLIAEGCRGVDLNPGDVQRALAHLASAGVEIIDRPLVSLSQPDSSTAKI